jgi:hypothetical protein
VRVDRPADGPQRTRSALDPEQDPLLPTDVVDAGEHALRVTAFAGAPSHTGIQSRPVEVFKNLFSFLFQRSASEERVAMYVLREHGRGRALDEILQDRYVQNRLSPDQQKRLLDRPEIVGAVPGEARETARASIEPSAS